MYDMAMDMGRQIPRGLEHGLKHKIQVSELATLHPELKSLLDKNTTLNYKPYRIESPPGSNNFIIRWPARHMPRHYKADKGPDGNPHVDS